MISCCTEEIILPTPATLLLVHFQGAVVRSRPGRPNLFQRIRFAEIFPDRKIVYAVSRQLSWTHSKQIIYLGDLLQREWHTRMSRIAGHSVPRIYSCHAWRSAKHRWRAGQSGNPKWNRVQFNLCETLAKFRVPTWISNLVEPGSKFLCRHSWCLFLEGTRQT